MAQIIEIPGVGEVEFPDSMSDADILAAVTKLARPAPKASESAARGGFQGLSLGFGDEMSAGLAAAMAFLDGEAAKGATLGERYRNARDFYRGRNASAETANPGTYLAGQVAGGVVPSLVAPGAAALTGPKALLMAAGQGAAAGAGYSEADDLKGLARDTAVGGALGTAGYGAGKILGKGLSKATSKGRGLVRKGSARAAEEGAEAATAPVRSLEAAARERAANAYRQMERINLALADKTLPAEERAALEAFKQGPEYAELLAANARGILAAAPDAAAERAAAQAIAGEARAALPEAIKAETAKRLIPQPKADTKTFIKGWAEPVAWAYGANKAAEFLGADEEAQQGAALVAGLIGGRTRAGKALWTRLNRPAHQVALGSALQRGVDRVEPAAMSLTQRSLPALMAALLATKETP